jgi:protein TonB
VVAGLALLSIGAVVVTVNTVPMQVEIVPEPPRTRPAIPVRTVPLPHLHKPEILIPEPPRFEILRMVEVVERPVAPLPVPKAIPQRARVVATPPAVEPPRFDLAYLENPAPAYPVFAKRAREQGKVRLRVNVDAEGRVTAIEIETSSGSDRLDKAALAAVKRWRFQPARSGGRAIAGIAIVPINFQLEG